jgi:hypothetical protein
MIAASHFPLHSIAAIIPAIPPPIIITSWLSILTISLLDWNFVYKCCEENIARLSVKASEAATVAAN